MTWASNALNADWWVTSFQAFSADTAWMSTTLKSPIFTTNIVHPAIWKTTNGGPTWIQNTNIPLDSNSFCDFMHFFNANEGLAFGDVHNGSWEAYFTSDGGLNWYPADSVPNVITGEQVHDNTHYVLGNYIWATSNQGRVFFSFDKGHNWYAYPVASFQFPQMFRVAFFDQLEGIAVRYNWNTNLTGNVYRTHNGGKSWSLLPHLGQVYLSYPEGGLFIVPGSSIVISNGGKGTQYGSSFSADSGATWTIIDNIHKFGAINGNDFNSLWAGQYSKTIGTGGVAKWDGTHLNINQIPKSLDFSIFPNPSPGSINIIFAESVLNTKLDVFNSCGQLLLSKNIKNESSITIDLSNYTKGLYFIKVQSVNGLAIRKVVIEKG